MWEELPIDEDVIERVERLAMEENQPMHNDKYPLFEWSPGLVINDDEAHSSEEYERDEDSHHQEVDNRVEEVVLPHNVNEQNNIYITDVEETDIDPDNVESDEDEENVFSDINEQLHKYDE